MNTPTNAEEPSPCQDSAPNSAPNNAYNAGSTVARRADKRNIPGQLPLVVSATAFPPAWGTVTTLIVLDQECVCGGWHNHRVKAPAPALLSRKARCGEKYQLMLHPPRVRRSRRAA